MTNRKRRHLPHGILLLDTQKHIKTFLSGLRTVCSAELNSLALRGGSAAPGGPRPTELCLRCRCSVHERAAIENDRVTVVCHYSQRLCVSKIVCAGECGCFACCNVLT